jgi:parvulin-like peptidyl-prolyl isomerase
MTKLFTSFFTPSLIVVAAVLFVSIGCSKSTGGTDSGVVAKVGSFEISDKHFENHLKRYFMRTGQAVNLNEDVRLAVVNARIERYAIVEHAREQGWATDAAAVYNKAIIERKVLMEEYQRRFIYDRIQLSEDQIRDVFRRSNMSVRASHLLAPTLEDANRLYERLRAGESFEKLAREVFQSPLLRDTGGDLGYFGIDEMDLAFEDAAFSMRRGEISRPVKTTTGFSVIKVTDVIEAPLLTEVQFAQQRPNMEQVALYQERERATRRDLDKAMNDFNWNQGVIDLLWNEVNAQRDRYFTSDVSLSELPVSLPENVRSQIVARLGGFSFSVNDFLIESYYTPADRRSQIQSKHDFTGQLEGMAYRSYALGLVKNHPGVDKSFIQESIDETFYGYLFERFESDLDTRIQLSDLQVRQAYNRDPSIFMQPITLDMSEIVLTDADLAGEVFTKLENGASFRQMLSEFGAETTTKKFDGHIGKLPITQFGSMASAIRSIQPGEYAGPFQVASNYYVILRCNERTESRQLAFNEAEASVREYLFSTERRQVRESIIGELRSRFNATIDMNRLNTISIQL